METDCLRKCRHCGMEAITVEDLDLFVIGDRSKHGRDNMCKQCTVVKNGFYIKGKDGMLVNRKKSRAHNRKVVPNKKAVIYVLSNPAFDGWYKIGRTTKSNVMDRVRTYSTASPFPYSIEYTIKVEDSRIEGDIIDDLIGKGVEYQSEWFYTDLKNIKMTVDYYATLTVEVQEELTTLRATAREFVRANEAE